MALQQLDSFVGSAGSRVENISLHSWQHTPGRLEHRALLREHEHQGLWAHLHQGRQELDSVLLGVDAHHRAA